MASRYSLRSRTDGGNQTSVEEDEAEFVKCDQQQMQDMDAHDVQSRRRNPQRQTGSLKALPVDEIFMNDIPDATIREKARHTQIASVFRKPILKLKHAAHMQTVEEAMQYVIKQEEKEYVADEKMQRAHGVKRKRLLSKRAMMETKNSEAARIEEPDVDDSVSVSDDAETDQSGSRDADHTSKDSSDSMTLQQAIQERSSLRRFVASMPKSTPTTAKNVVEWPDLTSAIKKDKKDYNGRYKSWTNKTVYDKLSARDKELHIEKRTSDYWGKRIKAGSAALCFYSVSGRARAKVCIDIVRIRKMDGLPRGWIGNYDEAVEAAEIHGLTQHDSDEDEDEDVEEAEDDVLENESEDDGDVIETSEDQTTIDNAHGVNPVDLLLEPTNPAPADNVHGVSPLDLLREPTYPTPVHSVGNHHTVKRAKTRPVKSDIHETITPAFEVDGIAAKGNVDYKMTETTLHITASESIEIRSIKMTDSVQVFFNGQRFHGPGVSAVGLSVNDQRTGRKRKFRDEDKENDGGTEVDVAGGAHDHAWPFVNPDE